MDLSKYIGLKYAVAGRGPDGYDCWGLVRKVYKESLGIELPEYPGVSCDSQQDLRNALSKEKQSGNWIQVELPETLNLVSVKDPWGCHHVGIFVKADVDRILHISKNHDSCLETITRLRTRGAKNMEYYKWHGEQ